MFSRWFAKSVFLKRPFLFEQLEERVVFDAAVPSTPDNSVTDQSAAVQASDAGSQSDSSTDSTTDQSATLQASDACSQPHSSTDSAVVAAEVLSSQHADQNSDVSVVGVAAGGAESGSETDSGGASGEVRVLVLSSTLSDADVLVSAAKEGVITVLYDSSTDSLDALFSSIQSALGDQKADSIAFACHELDDAQFTLTADCSVDLITVAANTDLQAFWQGIGGLLAENGRVDLMACDLASTDAGCVLVSQLESLVGHDVTASDDPTGNTESGGDWILEDGNVDVSATYFDSDLLACYQGLLADAAPVVSLGSDGGALDGTFDSDGLVGTDVSNTDSAQDVVIQSDGKIVAVGYASTSSTAGSYDFAVVRYNADGSLDTSFGGDGIVLTNFGSGDDYAYGVTIDSDGDIVVVGYATNASGHKDFAVARYNSDGTLDTGFGGGDGMTTTDISATGNATAQDVVIQADGKIVVVGYANMASSIDFAVVRYNSDGTLDTDFGTEGVQTTDFASASDTAYSVAIDADGKIVVAGTASGYDFGVVRYNTDGTLDTSFSHDGMVTTHLGSGAGSGYDVAIQSDGKIVVAGTALDDFGVVRYNTDGTLDTSFSGDGMVTTDLSGSDYAYAVAIQSDGKIVVVGYTVSSGNWNFAVVRYTMDGSLDTSFSDDGKVTTDFGSTRDRANAVAIQSDGGIVVAGQTYNSSSSYDFAVARYAEGEFPLNYTEGDGAQVIDSSITITDADSANMASATIRITGNYQDGEDILGIEAGYSLPSGVTAVWVASTGTLTISGSAVKAQYEAILEHVTYTNGSDDPDTGDRTVTWTVNDGTSNSAGKTSTITVTAVNDVPVLSGLGGALAYTEGDGAQVIDSSIPITDSDSENMVSATIRITGNYQDGEDILGIEAGYSLPTGVTAVWAASTGTLTISGSAAKALYEAILEHVTYTNGSDDPDTGDRTVTWTVNDGTSNSAAKTSTITVTAVNDVPVLSDPGGVLAYTEGDAAQAIDGSITITDPDSENMASATIRITGNYQDGEDVLGIEAGYSLPSGVTATWAESTGTLTISGSATKAQYETILEHVTYADSSDDPDTGERTVTWTVNDGTSDSASHTSTITVTAVNDAPVLTVYFADGSLDVSFDGDGQVSTDIVGSDEAATCMAVQSDGKIVVVGTGDSGWGTGSDLVLVRYNEDGSVDTTFGTDGYVVTDIDGDNDTAYAVIVQENGKILVVGRTETASDSDVVIVRYNADGSLDTGFGGGDGIVTTDITGNDDAAVSVAIQSDGTIVVVGTTDTGSNYDVAVLRYNTDGSLDTGFGGGDGIVTTDLTGNDDAAVSVAIESDGKIVVAGTTDTGSDYDVAVLRYNTDGSLDTGFDGDGIVTTDVTGNDDAAVSVVIQSDGKIVVAGTTDTGSDYDVAVLRYNTDGSLDTGFDGDGIVTTDVTGNDDAAVSVVIQSDGKIVVAGTTDTGSDYDVAVLRYNTDGSLDTGFDGDGIVTTDLTGNDDVAVSAAIQSDGKIVVAGSVTASSGTDFAVVRYCSGEQVALNYLENDGAVVIDDAITITDADSEDIFSATIRITGNYQEGVDTLSIEAGYVLPTGVSVTWDEDSGTLTFTGWATKEQYESILEHVTYANSSENPDTSDRTVTWIVGDGTDDSAPQSNVITVTAVNDAPDGADKTITIEEDVTYTLTAADFGFTDTVDSGANALASVTITQLTTAGSLQLDEVDVTIDQVISKADIDAGKLTFTPDPDVNGTEYANFRFAVTDDGGTANGGEDTDQTPNTITFDVTPVDDTDPTAEADSFTTVEDTTVSGTVAGNDSVGGDPPSTWAKLTDPSNGTLVFNADGTFTYTPNANFNGTDSFTYTLTDSDGEAATATVTITVTPVDDADPIAGADSFTTDEDTPVTGTVAGNDSVGVDTPATWSKLTDPSNGTVVVNADGTFTYTPNADFNGTDGFTYTVTDSDGETAVGTVTITVTPVGDAPSGTDNTITMYEDETYTLTVADFGFTDADGDNFAYVQITELPTSGTLELDGVAVTVDQLISTADIDAGKLTFTPDADAGGIGYASFGFAVIDDGGNTAGTLDTSFGGGAGIVITNLGGTDHAYSVTIQSDGKILVAGDCDGDFALVRYNADGTLDTSFGGGDGIVIKTLGGKDVAYSVAIQSDGKIVVAGYCDVDNENLALVRYNADGTLDTSFGGGDGIVTTGLGGSERAYSVAIQSDGKIVVAGYSNASGTYDFALVRYNADGTRDTTFGGGDGIVTTGLGASDYGFSVAIQSDGKIVVAGFSSGKFAVVRYNADGSLDTSFGGGDGIVTTNAGGYDEGHSVAIQSDGKIVVAGYSNASGTYDFALVRYNADGTRDTTFGGGDGIVTTGLGASGYGRSVAIQSDGKIVVAGYSNASGSYDFAVVRYNADGSLDTNFSDDGKLTTDLGGSDYGRSVAIQSDGNIVVAGYSGTDLAVVRYTGTSQDADLTPNTITFDVIPVDDADPFAGADAFTTTEDTALSGTVAGNDSVGVDAPATWSKLTDPTNGTLVFNDDGTFTYTPNADFNGTDGFTYTLTDSDGETTTATVTITVTPVDDADPNAGADSFTTAEDTALNGTVAGNDSVGVDTPATWSKLTDPSNGTLVLNADGTFTYTPNADFHGTDGFTYMVTDSDGETATATVTITVTPVDDADPTAGADSFTTVEDTAVSGTVAGNDSVGADTPATWSKLTDPDNGTLVLNADGTFTYTPNADFSGTDGFTYTLTDSDGETAVGTVTITVTPVDDADPNAGADSFTTAEDTALNGTVAGNDSVGVDTPATWSKLTDPSNGTLVLNADGTFTYTPNADFHGTDGFTYMVTDSDGETATATVTITVTPVDDADPIAGADSFTTVEDTAVTGSVAGNDSVGVDAPATWSKLTDPTNGTVIFNADGTFTYTPDADFNGTDGFTYTVTDSDGETAVGTVTITVTPVDDADPTAGADSFTTDEDTSVSGTVAGNDSVGVDTPATWSKLTDPSNGTLVLNADGTFTYTPNADFHGTDGFTYMVTDSDGETATATVTITVTPVDDTDPIAGADSFTTVEDTALSDTVAGNDSVGVDTPATWSKLTDPSNGTLVFNDDGTFTYTPNADFNGTDGFTYTLTDSDGETTSATVTITVTPVDDTDPIAGADSFTTDEDTALSDTVAGNDSVGVDTPATWAKLTDPSNGTLVLNADGTFTYTPNANFNGTDGFTYTLTDSDGETAVGTVTITVTPVDDADPIAGADSFTTDEDTAVSGTVAGNDSVGVDTPATWSKLTDPSNGTLVFNSDGTFTYTPNADFNGTDGFTYTLTDSDGETTTATVTITVTPVDDTDPNAGADSFTTDEDTALSGTVAGNDSVGVDTPATWSKLTDPTNGTLVFNDDGTFTYTPNADFNGTEGFTYTLTDSDGETTTATVTITVTPVDDTDPIARADSFTTDEDTVLSGTVAGNDSVGVDTPATWAKLTDPSNGTLVFNSDGTFTYTPNANFNGTDGFTYTLTDSDGETAVGTVTITVTPVDDADPIAGSDSFTTDEDTALSGTVAGNDTVGVDTPATWSKLTDPTNGTLVFNDDGTFTYTPNADFNGTEGFTYTLTDSDGETTTATVTITVTPVDDTDPIARADSFTTDEDTVLSGTVAGNDSVGVDTPATWSKLTDPSNGTLVFNSDGTFTYTPNADFNGTDGFTYTLTDSDGETAVGTVTVTVTPVDDADPIAGSDSFTTTEDTDVSGTVAGNDSVGVDTPATWSKLTDPSNGTLVFNEDGTFTYTPNADFNGTDGFTYTLTDSDGETAVGTVTITVTPVDDTDPTAGADSFTTTENTDVSGTVAGNDSVGVDTPATWSKLTDPSNGTLVFNNDGTFTYTPNADFNGTDGFTYRLTDSDGETAVGTVTVTVTPVDDADPIAGSDSFTTTEDTDVSGTVAGNDSVGVDTPATWSKLTDPSNGTLVFNSDGTFTYTPNADFNGTDGFKYTLTDSDGETAVGTVTITVTPVDDTDPNAGADSFTTTEDAALSGTVAGNDSVGVDTPATWSKLTDPSNGTLVFNSDGTFTYTPNADFNGTDGFTYRLTDSDGETAVGTVTVTVTPVNDAPEGTDKTVTMPEDGTYKLTTTDFGFGDPDDTPANELESVTITQLPTAGSLLLDGIKVTVNQVISKADIDSGRLTYVPDADANGSGYAVFRFAVKDDGGTANGGQNEDKTPNTVTFNVTPVNDAPVVSGIGNTLSYTKNDGAKVIDGTVTLTDVDSPTMSSAAIRITGNCESVEDALDIVAGYLAPGVTARWDSATGTLTLSGIASKADYETMLEHVTYTNSSNDPNTADRSVSWTVNDGELDSGVQTCTIKVTAANDGSVVNPIQPYLSDITPSDFLGADSGALSGTFGSTLDIDNLLSFLSSRQLPPFPLSITEAGKSEFQTFAQHLTGALYAEGAEARDRAWQESMLSLEHMKRPGLTEQVLSLEDFLQLLREGRVGVELKDILLAFNADEIHLAESFNSVEGGGDIETHSHEAPQTEAVTDWRGGRSFTFSIDDLRFTDLLLEDVSQPLNGAAGLAVAPVQAKALVFDPARLNFEDLLRLDLEVTVIR